MATKERAAAVVTIHRVDAMTARGRKAVAAWMRKQAAYLEDYGDQYAGSFRARYLYR